MKQIFAALLLVFSVAAVGCKKGKPSEEECKKAVEKIRALTGLDQSDIGADPEAMIRSCQANSSKKSVRCVLAADSIEELEKCEGAVGKEYMEAEEKRTEETKDEGEGG